ncbi:elongation factor 1-delta isoform X2 [Hydra vulgaris]|uniref:elongation factor 1-delta isoform X2 n=1 Tax=Hydra vulgaris TaxID=6087 RepID=UPI000192641F|nr:elongation factor 1-delta isoform X2 [Hydra vulgaris]
MQFPDAMMHENIWFDRPKYEEEREHYELFLTNNLSSKLAETHCKESKTTLNAVESKKTGSSSISSLESENKAMQKTITELVAKVAALESRVTKLEQAAHGTTTETAAEKVQKAKKDDDDIDLFGSEGSGDEEEDEAEKKRKEELLAKYNAKKASKPALIAKSSILIDVKPWDDETDMALMEQKVRSIEMDGLLWGASKLIPLAYGIKKLQILCVVEDDKVGTDILEEEITKFDDLVQSVDIASFNKI